MRPSESLTLDALAAQNAERTEDRKLLEQALAAEELALRDYDDREADEIRTATIEHTDKITRLKDMFAAFRDRSNNKVELIKQHMRQLAGRIPNPVEEGGAVTGRMSNHSMAERIAELSRTPHQTDADNHDDNVTELVRSAG